jgi:UDP-N-acetylmuramate: L-alanyl-gamma-D-glutamyl-meso-diaminopimelate ligase
VETFGLSDGSTWRAHEIAHADGRTRFEVTKNGRPFGAFESPLLGVHNVRNALAAIAVGAFRGIDAARLADGLRRFKGIKRRLETVGISRGVTVLDDFAHHPTAVHETLDALRIGYPDRRIWAVFEPRSASSCRRVFKEDFEAAIGSADEIIIA